MSMRDWYFLPVQQAFGKNVYNDFMVTHGVEYSVGPDTYAGPRGEPQQCFMNAFNLVMNDRSLTYCEGKVACHGVPIDHAWCITRDGIVVDPTIDNADGRITDYFGVPLKFEYVSRAILINDVFGVLDFFYARKTSRKLFELGLEKGQAWLISQSHRSFTLNRKTKR